MFYGKRIKELEEDVKDLFQEIGETDEFANEVSDDLEKVEIRVDRLEEIIAELVKPKIKKSLTKKKK